MDGSDGWTRVFGGFAALAVLWILVYWWWEPKHTRPKIDTPPLQVTDQASAPPSPLPRPVAPPTAAPSTPVSAAPTDAQGSRGSPTPSTGSAAKDAPESRVVAPKFRAYIVQKGDTFKSIAAKELGSSKYSDAISRSNPFVNPDKLKPGRELRIPLDPGNIQGRVEAVPSTPANANQTSPSGTNSGTPPIDSNVATKPLQPPTPLHPAPQPATPAVPEPVEYTVKAGDSLWKIAKNHYGDPSLADFIFESNKDRMKQPDDLSLGQKLRLPPKPVKDETR